MKLVIAGSRGLDEELIYSELVRLKITDHQISKATEIVSGCAKGADSAGEAYAEFYGIPIKKFPANWGSEGKAAGPIRNKAMAEYADAALIFWDGLSRGSKNMADHMYRRKKPVYIVKCEITETEDEIITTFKYDEYSVSTKKRKLSDV